MAQIDEKSKVEALKELEELVNKDIKSLFVSLREKADIIEDNKFWPTLGFISQCMVPLNNVTATVEHYKVETGAKVIEMYPKQKEVK